VALKMLSQKQQKPLGELGRPNVVQMGVKQDVSLGGIIIVGS